MEFKGFTKTDFDTFQIAGLDERMEAIRERIQPKFQTIGQGLTNDLSVRIGNEMFLHIAKHARRTVNPPKDTWLAIAHNKRGYKQHPHFQVGVFDDHVFVWLAFIYELPRKAEIAANFLAHFDEVVKLIPENFVISLDHMKKDADSVANMGKDGLRSALERFRDVKKAEFLVGRHIAKDNPLLKNGPAFVDFVKETFETLVPLYLMAF
ncbi:YktB family protein [Neobacillus sp. SM06]|uniref:YktB family protein n=1 Tax=Neobacillus sp. SM06 TaxID=3422492 RepID=UPI003D2714EC